MTSIPAEALDRACAEIFARRRRYLPDAEAQAEADDFRRRCLWLAGEGKLTQDELDETLAIVADAMAAS